MSQSNKNADGTPSAFVHLHVHSQYSILDAPPSIEHLVKQTVAHKMPAIALTDHGNLYGAVDFFKSCKAAKIKPIIGCEFYVAPGSRLEKKRESGLRTSYHLTLLAKNEKGYHNLCKLTSIGFLEGFYYNPRIDNEILQRHSEGLICLSGCINSKLCQDAISGNKEQVLETLNFYRNLFGEDYYLELMRHQMSETDLQAEGFYQESWRTQQHQDYIAKQHKANTALLELAADLKIGIVATNDIHYIAREDWKAHEILLNVQSGEPTELLEKDSYGNAKLRTPNPKRSTYPSNEYYFKTSEQMHSLFADLPEALSNTLVIADKCHVELDFKTKHYPVYTPPSLVEKASIGHCSPDERAEEVKLFLWKLCEEGIPKRYTQERLDKVKEIYPQREPMEVIRERLQYELDLIIPKGMADYLLIVWDFIHWAKSNGIPMGPGRGSGAGSIVLYLIGITDIEPLRFHLFFERFINPERLSYPDIDVDICMDRRNEVINYTLQKYGKANVAQIITFGTMKAKMTIKDIGRVLNIPLTKVNAIAKGVPDDLNITLEKALEKDADLLNMYLTDEDARRILDIGKKLEGSIRNTGIHAAGIIIGGQPLTEFIPLCNAKDSDVPVTQYSMKPVELVGMLKVDFLGLKTLTAIDIAVKAIQERFGTKIDWVNLPLDDKATFELLNQGKTLGVFQLESGGMQDLARNLHLDKFEEIIAVGALYRPGPMDMIPSFINRKHGREPIEYEHPWMEKILNETYGIMVYQEQVMQIASTLARYSLGEGDVLRRAMGKKDTEQMAKEREKFRQGASENGISEAISMSVFDKMEKFASYGFNKSHAAAYGYLSYVTAFLKANYPKEWMAALMTCDISDLTKIAKFIRECHSMNIAILPPDINEANLTFVATDKGIRFAMAGVKGIGSGVVEAIVQERAKGGPFTSLYNFFKRVDAKRVGRKVVESLIDAGGFDFTGWVRDALRQSVEPMFSAVAKEQADTAKGFLSLFSLIGDTNEDLFSKPPESTRKVLKQENLFKEKALLGFFLSGHPLEEFKEILRRLSCIPLIDIEQMDHDAICRAGFLIETVQTRISAKSQKKFAILRISDGMESYELPIWPELYEEKGHLLIENRILLGVLQVDKKEESLRLSCKWLDDLTQASDAMMVECDQAFDKAKHQVARFAAIKNKAKQTDEAKVSPTTSTGSATPQSVKVVVPKSPSTGSMPYLIKLNAESTHLSHILKLKALFTEHRGETPIHLDFIDSGQSIATLKIDSRWGITPTPTFEKELADLITP
ncbi:MAG: DNA polymerase III subunit alpha [Parachlamydiaceae bacterium]|nr:DNA polymerase III subunit alpha [Parachlamydiaceae bacterium]